MNSNDLIRSFNNTLELIKSVEELKDATVKAVASAKVYRERERCITKVSEETLMDYYTKHTRQGRLIVEENTSFESARKYSNSAKVGKVCVLNFANPHYAGGGVLNGAMAQEECLCRSSNLYPCIAQEGKIFEDYYIYNRTRKDTIFTDRLIYTSGVTVFKSDDPLPVLLEKKEWFSADVITCAAPYILKRKQTNRAYLLSVFKSRIYNIIETALENNVKILVLGAFGCGAFGNPPKVVARAFYEVICEENYCEKFDSIIFAIKSTKSKKSLEPCENLATFEMQFYGYSYELRAKGIDEQGYYSETMTERECQHYESDREFYLEYRNWRNQNKYYGKQFSVLGDSISTLVGYTPDRYNILYGASNCKRLGIKGMNDVWWGRFINFFGGDLLVNDAFSGCLVSSVATSSELFPSCCSDERTSELHLGKILPDVIVVFLGLNDYFNFVPVYSSDENKRMKETEIFSLSYEMMLKKLKANYPKAEIICLSLFTATMSQDASFSFPFPYELDRIESYNTAIKELCLKYGCIYSDIYTNKSAIDTMDGVHPTKEGMNTLANNAVDGVLSEKERAFLKFI